MPATIRGFRVVGVAALIAVLTAQVLAPDLLQRLSVGLAVVGILIGVPHGAVDHMVPFWTTGTRPGTRSMGLVLGQYLGVAVLAAAALVLAPDLAVTAFLVASAAHFGLGENEFRRLTPGVRRTPRLDVLRAVAHGGAVIVLPLGLWHAQVAQVLGPLAPMYAGDHLRRVEVALSVGVLALNAGLALVALRRGRWGEAAQIALIVAVFVVVPPLAAFAVYFGGWHAIRHTGRLLTLPGPGGAALPRSAAWRRYLLHAALPTLTVVAAMGILWADHSRPVIATALAVLVAITAPHLFSVAALDRWTAARRGRHLPASTPARPSS